MIEKNTKCPYCGIKLNNKNTAEYKYFMKGQRLMSVCKECDKRIEKEYEENKYNV